MNPIPFHPHLTSGMMPDDDSELIALARSGDREAQQSLWEKHELLVLRIVIGWLGHSNYRDHIEDLVHDVWVKFIGTLHIFDGRSPFPHWLSVLARNTCVDFLRRQRRPPSSLDDIIEEPEPKWKQQVQFDRVRLAEVLETLEPRERELLELYALGCSVPEVADRLGLTPDKVYSILKTLRRQRRRAQSKTARK